jgi:hypothetical protein
MAKAIMAQPANRIEILMEPAEQGGTLLVAAVQVAKLDSSVQHILMVDYMAVAAAAAKA